MSGTILNPDGTAIYNGGSITAYGGATTAVEVLADNSDLSYITFEKDESTWVTFTDPSVPAGAVIKAYSVVVRGKAVGHIFQSATLATELYFGSAFVRGTQQTITDTSLQQWQALAWTNNDNDPDTASVLIINTSGWADLVITKLRLDVIYVAKPVVTVADLTTVTDTNRPDITWTNTLDSDGGGQTWAQVRIFSEDDYPGWAGLDPATSTATAETAFYSAATTWHSTMLPDADYRAYVRVAQTVNGEGHVSDWDYDAFTMDTDLPGVPTVVVTPDDANGRIKLDIDSNTGDTTTDAFEIEVERAEGWLPLRTVEGDGRISDDPAEVWDYEAENGVATSYRVRAVHAFTDTESFSDWETQAGYLDGDWWLKHPTIPYYNVQVELRSFVGYSRAARQSVQQPLARDDAVITSDTRGPETGEITFRCSTDTMRGLIRRLATESTPLWLQAKAGAYERSRWIVLGDERIERLIDKSWSDERNATYTWTEVIRPTGDLVSWTYPEPEPIVLI